MADPFQFTLNDLQLFTLAWFRITGLMFIAPIFGSDTVPPRLKILLSLVFAMIFFSFIPREGVTVEPNFLLYIVWVLLELGVGMILGFAATLIFSAVQFGGQLIDQEMGLAMANVIDPISNAQISIVGQFKVFLATIVYLLIDGHHFLLSAISQSFTLIPLLGLQYGEPLVMHLSDTMIREVFEIAIKVAAPSLVTLSLITIAMAFMARTVPEMNIFIVGFALRLLVGFLILTIGVSSFIYAFERWSQDHEFHLETLIQMMSG